MRLASKEERPTARKGVKEPDRDQNMPWLRSESTPNHGQAGHGETHSLQQETMARETVVDRAADHTSQVHQTRLRGDIDDQL
jgi:hypothetical protein